MLLQPSVRCREGDHRADGYDLLFDGSSEKEGFQRLHKGLSCLSIVLQLGFVQLGKRLCYDPSDIPVDKEIGPVARRLHCTAEGLTLPQRWNVAVKGGAKAYQRRHPSHIREALEAHKGLSQFKYEVFLQGSYKNDTNLAGDSDVDVVVRMSSKLKPAVANLSGERLQENGSHKFVHGQWKSFRDEALKALRVRFGKTAKSGRKTLKVPKGKLPADADLVVTVSHREGIGFYLPDERRWVVSFPQQHHDRGSKKENATNMRFKRAIRMFKAARNRLFEKGLLKKEDAPSYFIECLLYNVPDKVFKPKLAPTYTGIIGWLKTAKLKDFKCQNGLVNLFGRGREQWTQEKARAFVKALQTLWDAGG